VGLFEKIARPGKKLRKGSAQDKARAQDGVRRSAEFVRIQALPYRELDLANVPDLSPIWRIDDHGCPGCELCMKGPATLRPIQSAALLEAEASRGLFAPMAVGNGKELTCLLMADAVGASRAVILTKPRLRDQMLNVDIPRYSRHFRLPLDRIKVVTYAELSAPVTGVGKLPQPWKWLAHLSAALEPVLEKHNPDWIIANECHELRNVATSRGRRFKLFMESHPGCRFAGLSGTIANDSIKHYAHLIEYALRNRSPLPAGYQELEDWSRALDVSDEPMAPGALLNLCGGDVFDGEIEKLPGDASAKVHIAFGDAKSRVILTDVARRIYARRFLGTPGVVASVISGDDDVGCALEIAVRELEIPDTIAAELERLRRLWKIEDKELSEAKDVAEVARQLACGFYYRWVWPDGKKDEEWLEKRSAWNARVRHIVRYQSQPGRDSPFLVAGACERGELDAPEWAAWKAVRDRFKPQPPVEAVWLDSFVVDDALAWARACTKDAPGIVWYKHRAMGKAFAAAGLPTFASGKAGDEIMRFKGTACAASIAHRDGKNLQFHFSRGLVTSPMANGTDWQQLLGRKHRPGQKADTVEFEVYAHDESQKSAIAGAIKDARFIEPTQRERQKILQATLIGMGDFVATEERWEGA
jgi:hypothetical protein